MNALRRYRMNPRGGSAAGLRIGGRAMAVGMVALGSAWFAAPAQGATATAEVQEFSQIGPVTKDLIRVIDAINSSDSTVGLVAQPVLVSVLSYVAVTESLGRLRHAIQVDPDPLINLRIEVENLTDTTQFFAMQFRFETGVTAGPTFKDAFANIELIDANDDGFARVSSASTFIDVVSDTGGFEINGSGTLGSETFYSRVGAGQQTLFDETGAGPNSDDFGGPGFNQMRFVTNGYLSAGDKLVITSMGAYSTEQSAIPERYEIPAVPEPATGLMAGVVGLALLRRRRGG